MLTNRERAVLDVERRHWRYVATKEAAIRTELDMSATRYCQVLNGLLESADAWEYAPAALTRARAVRDRQRHRRRAAA